MKRLALISDIHGNVPALDAVLGDIDSSGVTAIYCLGDLVGYGPDPSGVIARVRQRSIPTVKGNYDDGIGNTRGECGCYYATEQAKQDGAMSYKFTDAALDEEEHGWLASLPDDIRLERDGIRVLLAHGSPRKNNEYLLLDREDRQLVRLAEDAAADLVCIGHVHVPYHRMMTGTYGQVVHYVSSGSVGKPKDGDPRAGWVEVIIGSEADVRRLAGTDEAAAVCGRGETWVGAVTHRIAYDIAPVAEDMANAGLPSTLIDALRHG